MKIILLEIIALICLAAGIYFDQILLILGSVFVFYIWTCIYDYDEESQTQMYIQLLFCLAHLGSMIYVIIGLVKDALSMAQELLGPQPDFLYYLMVIALFIISYVVTNYLTNLLFNIIKQNEK